MDYQLIARGLVVSGGKLLLCKNLKAGHYFLPGGHVEEGEKPEDTLKREMVEESGAEVTNTQHVAEIENTFVRNEKEVHEIAHIYLAKLQTHNVVSLEDHIAFE